MIDVRRCRCRRPEGTTVTSARNERLVLSHEKEEWGLESTPTTMIVLCIKMMGRMVSLSHCQRKVTVGLSPRSAQDNQCVMRRVVE